MKIINKCSMKISGTITNGYDTKKISISCIKNGPNSDNQTNNMAQYCVTVLLCAEIMQLSIPNSN